MSLRSLTSALATLRTAATSRNIPKILPQASSFASSSRSPASHVDLNTIRPAKGSSKGRHRVGRGQGSGSGGSAGRGTKGAGARKGKNIPWQGFEGGGTPLIRKIPKRGFVNYMAKTFAPLPLSRLQSWIAQDRIQTSEPITIRSVIESNLIHGLSKFNGIKLLGDIDPNLPLPPLTIYLLRFSKSAAKAVLDAGGELKAVYHNRMSLRMETHPGYYEGKEMNPIRPTRRNDILYYTNKAKHGYLADVKNEFFAELGFNPRLVRGKVYNVDESEEIAGDWDVRVPNPDQGKVADKDVVEQIGAPAAVS